MKSLLESLLDKMKPSTKTGTYTDISKLESSLKNISSSNKMTEQQIKDKGEIERLEKN